MEIVIVGGSSKITGRNDNAWIGSTAGVAKIYKDKKLIGVCLDTPNAIASAMKHAGATHAVDVFGDRVKIDPATLAAGGWMTVGQSGWSAQ